MSVTVFTADIKGGAEAKRAGRRWWTGSNSLDTKHDVVRIDAVARALEMRLCLVRRNDAEGLLVLKCLDAFQFRGRGRREERPAADAEIDIEAEGIHYC